MNNEKNIKEDISFSFKLLILILALNSSLDK